MKKHHILLILLLVATAAYFLNEGRRLKDSESIASEELNLLRDAVKRSPGATASSSPGGRGSRPSVIDTTRFTSELNAILNAGSSVDNRRDLEEFLTAYGPQLESAPLSKLKEISDFLEQNHPFGQAGTEGAELVWFGVVRLATKSDPAWAFAKLDQAASTSRIPISTQLSLFKTPAQSGDPMSPGYAAALQKWLDAAQAAGRIEEADPLVAGLRAEIAAAQGDFSAAVNQISQLPNQSQRKAAIAYLNGLATPEEQRKGMEDLSTVLNFHHFTAAVRSLAERQGFDAAREILSSAALAPEQHDLAAAGMASATIGPETGDRADWLLENLRSEEHEAIDLFTRSWTEGNHADAANWIATMRPGPRRDAALGGFIPVAARIDGATAMDWALTVSDPLLRNRLYCEARRKWQETDAEQATAYSKAHPLDSEALEAAGD